MSSILLSLSRTSLFLYLQMKFLFLSATSLYSSKITVYFSSQTCPKEMSDKLCKYGNAVAVFAAIEILSDKGNHPSLDGEIVSASGRMTNSPL